MNGDEIGRDQHQERFPMAFQSFTLRDAIAKHRPLS